MRTSVRRFLSVFLSLCSLREAKKIKIKQATLRPCAISFKLRLPSLEWQCTITPQIATRGCSKTCLEDYLSMKRQTLHPLSFRKKVVLMQQDLWGKHASPLRFYIPVCTPPRRNVVHGCNLTSNHRISLPRCRTQRFKISFFSGNGLFKIVMHFYIVCIYIF